MLCSVVPTYQVVDRCWSKQLCVFACVLDGSNGRVHAFCVSSWSVWLRRGYDRRLLRVRDRCLCAGLLLVTWRSGPATQAGWLTGSGIGLGFTSRLLPAATVAAISLYRALACFKLEACTGPEPACSCSLGCCIGESCGLQSGLPSL